ncbi:MAG: group II intron reverse transcriptase domain-containing protein [Planctomycetes bacterium]|nr:group II intron reverse transcriptase domain-containing protein [Planctomycetota bacterium]
MAAPFPDRVVHAALVRVLEPVFEPGFTNDTYACGTGKGTHAALDRLSHFLRKRAAVYCLKCDISKFFASIDHTRLREILGRRIKDPNVLWLCDRIVDSFRTPPHLAPLFPGDDLFTRHNRPCGLPIGNLSSQLWSTLALDPMDRFIKQELHCRYYVRYADDFVILDASKERLQDVLRALRRFLVAERLRLAPEKCRVFPARLGIDFLGFMCFRGYRLLRKSSGERFRKRLRALRRAFARGELSTDELGPPIQSWISHAAFGKTWGFRRSLLSKTVFVRKRE